MSVYVDSPYYAFGRMVMCHMAADTSRELLGMADKIGVARKWIQAEGTYREHFDICKSARVKAVAFGAKEVTSKDIAKLMRGRNVLQKEPKE